MAETEEKDVEVDVAPSGTVEMEVVDEVKDVAPAEMFGTTPRAAADYLPAPNMYIVAKSTAGAVAAALPPPSIPTSNPHPAHKLVSTRTDLKPSPTAGR